MDRLKAMQVFVTVVELGSQSAAAERLELSRPVVSRYLSALENWTDARLLHRTTRRLGLTSAGKEVLQRCQKIMELSGEIQAAALAPDERPRGLLRVTASTAFGQAQLTLAIAEFVGANPGLKVDLVFLDRAVNLVDERIDLAIRITVELDPNLIARRLTVCRSALCASPQYLRTHPLLARVEELRHRNCLTHSYYGKNLWQFTRSGEAVNVPVSGNLSANDSTALVQATQAGLGIALLPTFAARPLLDSGELVELLPDSIAQELSIFAVYTSRRHLSPAMRAMLDFLATHYAADPPWDLPPAKTSAQRETGGDRL